MYCHRPEGVKSEEVSQRIERWFSEFLKVRRFGTATNINSLSKKAVTYWGS
jgi:hypothetical protein